MSLPAGRGRKYIFHCQGAYNAGMLENESKIVDHRISMGGGFSFDCGAGKIFKGEEEVGSLGRETRKIFEIILRNPGTVPFFYLAVPGGLVERDDDYPKRRILGADDIRRVQASIHRIRVVLRDSCGEEFARRLHTERMRGGFRWNNSEEEQE